MKYEGDLTMLEARARYFAANGFGDGGYDAAWVKLQAGPVPLFLPNTQQRVRSVRLHDLHHVVTEYDTTWTGESEIGAWEIASGCADHYAAWVLNLWAFAIGLFIVRRPMFRAFVRGRRSRNLFEGEFDEALLTPTVTAMRSRLHLDRPPSPPTRSDRVSFVGFALLSVLTLLGATALALLPIIVVIWLLRRP
jgi:hypothetical protein